MNRFSFLGISLLLTVSAFASDQIRSVQSELKTQGFYYGDVNGETTAETTSAIRRFQIRNGLEVTGTLTPETLSSLGIGSGKAAPPKTATSTPAPGPSKPAPRKTPTEESDRKFLEREEQPTQRPPSFFGPQSTPEPYRDSSVVRPPAPLEESSGDFTALFARTPYENAPRAVQQRTLRNAQAILASRGFYRDDIDGEPGPATEEALLSYQRFARLPLTGRLDLQTLSQLRLLPGESHRSVLEPFHSEPAPRRTYRGVWVN